MENKCPHCLKQEGKKELFGYCSETCVREAFNLVLEKAKQHEQIQEYVTKITNEIAKIPAKEVNKLVNAMVRGMFVLLLALAVVLMVKIIIEEPKSSLTTPKTNLLDEVN